MFDFNNPIATKGNFKICFDGLAMNNKQLYCLYQISLLVGYFDTLESAKNKTNTIQS